MMTLLFALPCLFAAFCSCSLFFTKPVTLFLTWTSLRFFRYSVAMRPNLLPILSYLLLERVSYKSE